MQMRATRGNMLFFCTALLALLTVGLGLAFGVYFIFFAHKKLQSQNESIALQAAQILNFHDCSGKLNNLQRASRELVFDARQMSDRCLSDEYSELAPLAYQIAQESRSGASLVNDSRSAYMRTCETQIRDLLKANPDIVDCRLGQLSNTSNVEAQPGNSDLYLYDCQQKYLKKGKLLELYCSEINLKLPGPDDDLTFVLSTLPPPVRGTIASLRLTGAERFKKTLSLRQGGADTLEHFKSSPSAAQILMNITVKQSILPTGFNQDCTTSSTSTASCNGAAAEPYN